MTLHVTITEYTTSLGDVVEKKKAYIKINEFDISGTLLSKVTGIGSILVGDGVGSLVDFPAGVNGATIVYDDTLPKGMKTVVPTTVEATMTNRSGVDMEAGTVCILHTTADSITTTDIASDRRVLCITAEAIPDLNTGRVIFYGVATVKVTGAVAVGQWLVSSTSASRAKAAGYTKPIGAIGIATTANVSGDGTVTCILAFDWYLTISAGKGYLQGNYPTATLNQILSFITETSSGGTALPANQNCTMGVPSPSDGYLIATASVKTPFATDTPAATVSANLVTAGVYQGPTGGADNTKGFVAGIYVSGVKAYAEKILFASDSASLVSGADLSVARRNVPGMTDTNNLYFSGGFAAAVSAITDKLALSTETTSAVAGANLTTARSEPGTISNPGSFGLVVGGWEAAASNKVDKITYATDTAAASTVLAAAKGNMGGLSAANGGYSCGGNTGGYNSATGISTAVESIPFATLTPAALAGAALPTAQCDPAAMSTLN